MVASHRFALPAVERMTPAESTMKRVARPVLEASPDLAGFDSRSIFEGALVNE
jgi:hypothetical protein